MDNDLFTPRMDDETQPAPCGFRPTHGWPHKWARDGHRDTCDTCGDIENKELFEKYGSEGSDLPACGDAECKGCEICEEQPATEGPKMD